MCWFRNSVSWFTRARGEGLERASGGGGEAEAWGKSKPPVAKGKLAGGGGGEGESGSVLGMLRGHGVSGGVEEVDVEVEEGSSVKEGCCDIAVLHQRTPHGPVRVPFSHLGASLVI